MKKAAIRKVNGKGESYGSLFGLISLGRFYAEPAVTLSSLLRYLGESVWTPQAFLPSNGCSWTPTETLEGKNAFMATIHDAYCGETARTIFSFDAETGLPDRMVIPQRPRMVGKVMVPSDMGGICSEPKSFSGVVVPSYQEAWWVVEEGRKLEMWKARIVDIQWGF